MSNFEKDIDLMDGMFAYDTGCVSSGIKDPLGKERLQSDADYSFRLATELLKQYMSEGYTIEDAKSFLEWFEVELEFDI